jgi:hypothetical protein
MQAIDIICTINQSNIHIIPLTFIVYFYMQANPCHLFFPSVHVINLYLVKHTKISSQLNLEFDYFDQLNICYFYRLPYFMRIIPFSFARYSFLKHYRYNAWGVLLKCVNTTSKCLHLYLL